MRIEARRHFPGGGVSEWVDVANNNEFTEGVRSLLTTKLLGTADIATVIVKFDTGYTWEYRKAVQKFTYMVEIEAEEKDSADAVITSLIGHNSNIKVITN